MYGLPKETISSTYELIKLISKIRPDHTQISCFYPFKGTALGDLCYENNWVLKKEVSDYFTESVLDLPTLKNKDINKFFKMLCSARHLSQKTNKPLKNFIPKKFYLQLAIKKLKDD